MNTITLPSYLFKGRTYKTVAGLSKAIFSDCNCDAHSMVVDRVITATVGRNPNERVVARYSVSEPTPGAPMKVVRIPANTCPACEGDKVRLRAHPAERGGLLITQRPCSACKGTGMVPQ